MLSEISDIRNVYQATKNENDTLNMTKNEMEDLTVLLQKTNEEINEENSKLRSEIDQNNISLKNLTDEITQ